MLCNVCFLYRNSFFERTIQKKPQRSHTLIKRRQRKQREPAANEEYTEEDDGGVDRTEGWEVAEEVEQPDTGLDSAYEEEEEEERSGGGEVDAEEDGERERWEEEEEERRRDEWERRRMEMERGRLGGHVEEEGEEGGASYPSHFYPKVPSLVTNQSLVRAARRTNDTICLLTQTGPTRGARRPRRKGAPIIVLLPQ